MILLLVVFTVLIFDFFRVFKFYNDGTLMFYDFLTSISKKSGILTHNEMDSALVDLSVPVSNFFRELLSMFV